jgi:cell division protease FtsH
MPPNATGDPKRRRQFSFSGTFLLIAIAVLYAVQTLVAREVRPKTVPYSELLDLVESGKVAAADVRATEVIVELKSTEVPNADQKARRPERVRAERLPNLDEEPLLTALRDKKVTFAGKIEQTSWLTQLLLGWVLPLGVLALIYGWGMRRVGKGVGPLSIGKSKAKIYDVPESERVTFEDVAGVDEAEGELVEVVDFLKNPQRYQALGARIPKGILLVGPPGTGKTLLAKAVAGESGVPFFSMTGSDFVEMFVGVGAARVRDLFEQAKERAPCIIFIDEIDAIGRSRGGLGVMGTHDEREQTLNQLLAEMDGFDGGKGIVIMAATNRPETLDPALVRAGRFDRQVVVDRPDLEGREAILRVHVKRVSLGAAVDLGTVAKRTPGMVGADLALVVNEAALAAARRGSKTVEQQDFEEAVDRIQLGLRKRGKGMTEAEKRRVAFHEAGHTLVALSVKHADPVHRVTIIPRSIGALGVTLQLPTEERFLMTREELHDRICVMMGGRAAEELVWGDVSTGAQNDLERATETARQMVCRFGMSAKLGAATYGQPAGMRFLDVPVDMGDRRNFSEETARAIDEEVRAIVEGERSRARALIEARRAQLDALAHRLLEEETLERDEIEAIAGPRIAAA